MRLCGHLLFHFDFLLQLLQFRLLLILGLRLCLALLALLVFLLVRYHWNLHKPKALSQQVSPNVFDVEHLLVRVDVYRAHVTNEGPLGQIL